MVLVLFTIILRVYIIMASLCIQDENLLMGIGLKTINMANNKNQMLKTRNNISEIKHL